MLSRLLDIPGMASTAAGAVPQNGREQGGIMGLMLLVPVAAILLFVSLI